MIGFHLPNILLHKASFFFAVKIIGGRDVYMVQRKIVNKRGLAGYQLAEYNCLNKRLRPITAIC